MLGSLRKSISKTCGAVEEGDVFYRSLVKHHHYAQRPMKSSFSNGKATGNYSDLLNMSSDDSLGALGCVRLWRNHVNSVWLVNRMLDIASWVFDHPGALFTARFIIP